MSFRWKYFEEKNKKPFERAGYFDFDFYICWSFFFTHETTDYTTSWCIYATIY